jgi:hypothetical protein
LTHPVRLSALAALDIQQAREWHDAQEPGLGDKFLQRVNETMTRIGQTHQGRTFGSSNTQLLNGYESTT